MTNNAYRPRANSLAARVVDFFLRNPEEELGLDDICQKFDVPRLSIHSTFWFARDAGLLDRYKNEDGEYLYRAGPNIDKASGVNIDSVHDRRAKQKSQAATNSIDPALIRIDDNIEIPSTQKRKKSKWMPLLERMKLGQSAEIPLKDQYTLRRDISNAKREGVGTYTVRVNEATQTLRIWRTA